MSLCSTTYVFYNPVGGGRVCSDRGTPYTTRTKLGSLSARRCRWLNLGNPRRTFILHSDALDSQNRACSSMISACATSSRC